MTAFQYGEQYYLQTDTGTCGNLTRYYSCPNISDIWEGNICAHQCLLRQCERQIVAIKERTFVNSPWSGFQIIFDNMNLVMFDEQLKWSFEKFLGIIGGTVSFLLGYCFFDMLCLVFLLSTKLIIIFPKRIKMIIFKKSQVAIIEVKSATGVSVNNIERNIEHPADYGRIANFVRKFKKNGSIVGKPRWIMECIFKSLLIAYFGYLTVKMCIPIILNYKESSTHFVISLALNEPLYLKSVTLCIALDPHELDDTLQSHSRYSLTKKYETEMQNFFNRSNITKEKFLGDVNWTNTLRYIIYTYVSLLSDFETEPSKYQRDLTVHSLTDSTPRYFYEKNLGKDMYLAQILLESKMNLLNITVNELRRRLGREVISLHYFRRLFDSKAPSAAFSNSSLSSYKKFFAYGWFAAILRLNEWRIRNARSLLLLCNI